MTEGDVITIFSQYGEVMDVNLPRDKTTGKQRGFGFLMYEDQRSTVLAVDNLNGAQVLGRTLRVDHVQNYKQPKVKGEDGEMEEAAEQSLNAKPQMIYDDAEESDGGSVSSAPSIDPEDPMASYLLQKRREEKARSKGKDKEKSKRKRDRTNETPEERRARKERKRAKREAKEGVKRDRDQHTSSDTKRRDHSRERRVYEKRNGSLEREDRHGRDRSEYDRPRHSSRSPRSLPNSHLQTPSAVAAVGRFAFPLNRLCDIRSNPQIYGLTLALGTYTTMEQARRTDVDEENAPLLPARIKFSWRMLIVLFIYTAIVNGASELVWPFINQLIVNVGIAPDEKSVGFYSGLMVDFAAVLPGSFAADRWGRKVVLCSTLIGTSIGLTFFGTSKTLFSLIFFRCVGYALGPQLGWATTVTILGDVSDPSNRGVAFSAVNAAYRVGQLFSPIFASMLAHPKDRYKWFQSDFWDRYPYALSCWAGAATCILALGMTICYVPETAPSMLYPKSEDFSSEAIPQSIHTKYSTSGLSPTHIEDETAPARMVPATMEPVTHDLTKRPTAAIFTPHVVQLLISSWVMYFMTMGFFSLFPLWAFTPISSGGLGASEIAIGSFISARAIAQFLVLIPFAYFETRLGVYRLYAYSLAVYTISGAIGFPLLNVLAQSDGIASFRFSLAIAVYFILGGAGNYCTTCMVIMINQAAPTPYDLAQLVGISQSVLMLGQCMAPIIVLSIFEFSIKSGLLGGNIIWIFLGSCSLIASVHSFQLRAPVCEE
ncbi:major facilitator superfamily transporter [Rhizoctonia solani]|uniref:Major facilitator superfamily transporter n=1 Tax=Rhizoctonia solani TaxID=456999 RepID=A0A8H8NNS8_9AGAM|nr:major facilitator superfamily transporter [Rhizoctonia solani]QRW15855.1 major facilitator superfamily transporter [Rhizoctonia solani]